MNATEYLAQFNTNPACAGVGPTAVVPRVKLGVQLVLYLLGAITILVTTAWYLRMRFYRRRLRIRGLNPLITGSLGSTAIVLVRVTYNMKGMEHMSCALNIALVYLFFIINLIPDNLAVANFFVKQKYRAQVSSTVLQQAAAGANSKRIKPEEEKEKSERHSSLGASTNWTSQRRNIMDGKSATSGGKEQSSLHIMGHHWATPVQWFKGLWNHLLHMVDATSFCSGDSIKFNSQWQFPEEETKTISPLRELTYEFVSSMMFAGPLWFGMGMRIGLVPAYNPKNHCTGCRLFWEDLPILVACLLWLGNLQFVVLYRTRDMPDPLNYRRDLLATSVILSIAWIGYALAVVDPGDLMATQKANWFAFEAVASLCLHLYRCVFQLLRVARFHRLGEQQIRLIDILQDNRVAILFEKYLMGELASENLLFWREALKYKLAFDKNKDLDYSQQVARILFRTFVSRQAQLPINISGRLRDSIESRFRSGFVGKNVFDEALIEVYNMMQNGPFYRFVRTKEFAEYSKNNADFSLIPTTASDNAAASTMSVIPASESMRDDVEGGYAQKTAFKNAMQQSRFDVSEYIHSL